MHLFRLLGQDWTQAFWPPSLPLLAQGATGVWWGTLYLGLDQNKVALLSKERQQGSSWGRCPHLSSAVRGVGPSAHRPPPPAI